MVVAIYRSNRKSSPEEIRVHKYSDGMLRVESITNSYAHEIGDKYNTIAEVEQYLRERDRVSRYCLVTRL